MNHKQVSPEEIFLFHQGNFFHSYRTFGAHFIKQDEREGVRFAVWAPNAAQVNVVGDFNNWQGHTHPMHKLNSGIWVAFIEGIKEGELYKYEIITLDGASFLKADPYGFFSELRPNNASVIFSLDDYQWSDTKWHEKKASSRSSFEAPLNIYEVHLGSWRRKANGQYYSFRELTKELLDYVDEMGYTHIELLPIMEHPYDGSWGYQLTGYYSVTSRFGNPRDFMYFVDQCHQRGIGVILDWVPGHFCKDAHGLAKFDGTNLYEEEEHVQWGTLKFNFARPEVISFLISNAVFWFDVFHIDGLRIDGVSSMLYLDFGKKEGQWQPNRHGGRENLAAIEFMQKLNEVIFKYYPQALMIAEESTDWPLVTGPTYLGGLGYNYKWNMGWMNDVLRYMEMDPLYRKWHHNLVTFSFMYAFTENFVIPLSHDEVVHGKKSLIEKMPGDYWQKFANLRVLYCYLMTHPGKKLLFMGGEFAQFIEWREYEQLEWFLLDYEMHQKFHKFVKDLNHLYLGENSLWEKENDWTGFQWIDANNHEQSILVFQRLAKNKGDFTIIVLNFTPVVYEDYRLGVPNLGVYKEIFNSDMEYFGGSGQYNGQELVAENFKWHNQPYSIKVKVPPLGGAIFKLFTSSNYK